MNRDRIRRHVRSLTDKELTALERRLELALTGKPTPIPMMRCPLCLSEIGALGGDPKSAHTDAPGCLLRGAAREVISGKVHNLNEEHPW